MKYGFIGMGNMASAIINGMVNSGAFANDEIYGYDRHSEKCEALKDSGVVAMESAQQIVQECDVIVYAVKPQGLPALFDSLKGTLQKEEVYKNKLFISIAAGKTLAWLGEYMPCHRIVRVMPNLNAAVGASTSAYAANNNANSEDKLAVEKMFETVGTIIEIEEKLFSIFTAIGGSSPAFAFMYIDALARVGVKYGMKKDVALKVAASTVFGSAKNVMESGMHPMELCDKVCSPAGTTIEGVLTLQKKGFENAVHEAIGAVADKDNKL